MSAPADTDRFEEALAWFRRRIPTLTAKKYSQMTARARNQAFKVAGVTNMDVLQDVFDALEKAIANGETLHDFRNRIGTKIATEWGHPDSPRVETIFRTNVQLAYSGGRERVFQDDDVRSAFPFAMYSAVMDSRTSPICRPLNGTILPVTHPWWNSHTPPLHFRCRATKVPLTAKQAGRFGTIEKPPRVSPQAGFGGDPLAGWKPDLSRFDPSLRKAFRAGTKRDRLQTRKRD